MQIQILVNSSDLEAASARGLLSDLSVPLSRSGDYQLSATLRNFDNESDPDGRPWADLALSTWLYKRTKSILQETRRMINATQMSVAGNVLRVFNLTPYAGIHNDGTSRIAQRRFLGFSDEDLRAIVGFFEDYLQSLFMRLR
ncbi:phage virion morphogenesis protein [Brasilonema sp. UFV-L1]|uniref:phage virion morphogenesis protein n=1 Tax=Brasilonema sp. UFV-L1 TaxID=2234130 RepID=UPI00145F4B4D|nr:phage virion morphogenesis protein [Brasilonema sp. UFV-L1]NMG11885.1 hypothetical protein [Brasilonema sp. UFV-L1]